MLVSSFKLNFYLHNVSIEFLLLAWSVEVFKYWIILNYMSLLFEKYPYCTIFSFFYYYYFWFIADNENCSCMYIWVDFSWLKENAFFFLFSIFVKAFDLLKFLTSTLWCTYMFLDFLNKIWYLWKMSVASVGVLHNFCGYSQSRTEAQNFMKFYI